MLCHLPSKVRRSLCLGLLSLLLTVLLPPVWAQEAPPPTTAIDLPQALPPAPVIAAAESGQYVLEFNRSPAVGNRLRFEGIYDEERLRFTRPRSWEPQSVQVLLRYRHSAALYATRSNLTVRINGTSIGSIPLNQPQGEIGDAVFDVPVELLQDYNELLLTALQNNSPTCTQDPFDPSLWTEVLPDSKLVFDFQPQAVEPNFSQFPYPLFDVLSLQKNQVAYLQPQQSDSAWLTAAARLQGFLGRTARYRPLENRLVSSLDELAPQERLVVLGTPEHQPLLGELDLPFALENGQFRDGDGQVLADDAGLLMWTTLNEGQVPVLVITANGEAGLGKAAQYLVQSEDRQIATGYALVVNQVSEVPAPPLRQWPGYLPAEETFELQELGAADAPPLEDVTVRGSHSPALQVDFKALPDDRFLAGSRMVLNYSYGPQINPLTSMVDVELDGVSLEGERLTAVEGAQEQKLAVDLPPERITPTSQLQVNFRLDPRERRSCSRVTDQQLWGTIHADSQFTLKREAVANLPDLKLLQTGFPFTAPQDLSTAAMVLPPQPQPQELELMLEMAERLGRLSRADSIQLQVFSPEEIEEEVRRDRNLILIGSEDRFPYPEILTETGFTLRDQLVRRWGDSQVQPLPDEEGVLKTLLSPWNEQRVVLALSGRDDTALQAVKDLIRYDPLFYQLEGDTALVSAQETEPDPYDSGAYRLEFLRQSPQVQVASTAPVPWLWKLLRMRWVLLTPTVLILSLLIYAAAQAYLQRVGSND